MLCSADGFDTAALWSLTRFTLPLGTGRALCKEQAIAAMMRQRCSANSVTDGRRLSGTI
jgi:hypothetical protein